MLPRALARTLSDEDWDVLTHAYEVSREATPRDRPSYRPEGRPEGPWITTRSTMTL